MSIINIESIRDLSPLLQTSFAMNLDGAFSPSETYLGRVWRHVKSGQIDYRTIRRGFHQLTSGLRISSHEKAYLEEPKIEENYGKIEGLTSINYFYVQNTANDSRFQPGLEIRLYEFPRHAKFQVCATSPAENCISSLDFFDHSPDAIAYFTGPTFYPDVGLPNNGFYLNGYPKSVNFEDTKPSGQRRGAFAISKNGELVVIDDSTKWQLIRANFPNIQALIGGANYLKTGDRIPFERADVIRPISYLFQYLNQNEQISTGFAFTNDSCTRNIMNQALVDFTSRRGARAFIGLEMEYGGSSCFIKDQNHNRYGGYNDRYDHYLVAL